MFLKANFNMMVFLIITRLIELVKQYLIMEIHTKDHGKMGIWMDLVYILGKMVRIIMVIFKKVKKMEKVNIQMLEELFLKVCGKMVKEMEKEFLKYQNLMI
jgi:hypothetical protein